MPLEIAEFEFDDHNEPKLAAHGVSIGEVAQVLDGGFRVFRNKKEGAGTHLLVGRTYGGRLLTIPIIATPVPGRWRPITAWDSSSAERTRYEN